MVLDIDFLNLFDIDFSFTNKSSMFWKMETIFIQSFIFAHCKQFVLKNLVECPSIKLSTLNFHVQLDMNGILYIEKKYIVFQ